MPKFSTVTYHAGYKISQDFCGMEGAISVSATVDDNESPEEAIQTVRATVRDWLKQDHAQAKKTLSQLISTLPESQRK